MASDDKTVLTPSASFDGGALDCGSGLLLLIRQHIDPLREGQLLEIASSEASSTTVAASAGALAAPLRMWSDSPASRSTNPCAPASTTPALRSTSSW